MSPSSRPHLPPLPPQQARAGGRWGGPAARRGRAPGLVLCVLGALLVGSGLALADRSPQSVAAAGPSGEHDLSAVPPAPRPVTAERALPAAATGSARNARAAARAQDAEAAPPRRLRIEGAGVDTALIGLRRLRDGTLEVPEDFDVAGWYREGVAPGDRGPAVLVGHVDSYTGPAVFYRIPALRDDDRIVITRTDGSKVVFAVYDRETIQKDDFPTARVYGDTDDPELRLLTCGGPFDTQTRHYRDNVVVYARQVDQ